MSHELCGRWVFNILSVFVLSVLVVKSVVCCWLRWKPIQVQSERYWWAATMGMLCSLSAISISVACRCGNLWCVFYRDRSNVVLRFAAALVQINECKQGSVIATQKEKNLPAEASSHSCDAYYTAACSVMQEMQNAKVFHMEFYQLTSFIKSPF